jgi:hypothetical protein
MALRLGCSILMRWVIAGCVLFLAGGMVWAQGDGKSSSGNSTAKLQSASANPASRKAKKTRKSAKNGRKRGQQKIDSARCREIQEALIREHYLDGTASGVWDANSQKAMERYQSDNGWQSKTVPDSRALIKLGLGPGHEHLLNPESAMTSQPDPPHATPASVQAPAVGSPPQK